MQLHSKLAKKVFSFAKGKQAEVVIFETEDGLTRFATNVISQNLTRKRTLMVIKLMEKGKAASAEITDINDKSIKQAIEDLSEILKHQKSNPEILDLVKFKTAKNKPEIFDKTTAEYSPLKRASDLAKIVKKAKQKKQTLSGIFQTGYFATTIANSKGTLNSGKKSYAIVDFTVQDKDGSAMATATNTKVSKIDLNALFEKASLEAKLSRNPKSIKAGKYTVLLESDPIENILMFAGWYTFSGKRYNDKQSYFSGRLGKKVFSDKITIAEDCFAPGISSLPFDMEGSPKEKIVYVDKGVAKAVTHDRVSAKKAKTKSTSGASGSIAQGPMSSNLILKGGTKTFDQIIKGTKKGLLVKHFHYVNMVNPQTLDLTGMTRNGTFLIENGKIKHAVKNMRFTESIVNAFNNVTEISKETESNGRYEVPLLMKVDDFNFSSETNF